MGEGDISAAPNENKGELKEDFPIVGIGASAGGLEALRELFEHLPNDGMSCVVVQHLDPAHKSLLADILSKKTGMNVQEAKEGAILGINLAYIIPPDTLLTISDGTLHLSPRKEIPGLFLPIDRFFRSLARNFGERAIGIVLSGGGSDGALGIQEIKECGGMVFAQDQKSALFFSMPQSSISTGSVDFVLPPKEIAIQLGHLISQRYWAEPDKFKNNKLENQSGAFREILSVLHKKIRDGFLSLQSPHALAKNITSDEI